MKRFIKRVVFICVANISFFMLHLSVNADQWGAFDVRRYVSSNGKYEVIVSEDKKAKLFSIGSQCNLIWDITLPCLPRSAYISDDGKYFVIIDRYYGNDEESYGFILFAEKGRIVCEYRIKDLIDLKKTFKSASSIWWYNPGGSGFTTDGAHFLIENKCGKSIIFKLGDGKRIKEELLVDSAYKIQSVWEERPTAADELINKRNKQILLNCKITEKVKIILKGFKDNLTIDRPEVSHLLQFHSDIPVVSFVISGVYVYKDHNFSIRSIPIYANNTTGLLDTYFNMDLFEIKANCIIEELSKWVMLSEDEQVLAKEIDIGSWEFDFFSIKFDIKRPVYSYTVLLGSLIKENNTVGWLDCNPRDVINFIGLLEEQVFPFLPQTDEEKNKKVPILIETSILPTTIKLSARIYLKGEEKTVYYDVGKKIIEWS